MHSLTVTENGRRYILECQCPEQTEYSGIRIEDSIPFDVRIILLRVPPHELADVVDNDRVGVAFTLRLSDYLCKLLANTAAADASDKHNATR